MYGRFVDIKCGHCRKKYSRKVGHVNRSKKIGAQLYCNRVCAGLGRRKNKTIEQKKAEKRQYDMQYRDANREAMKEKKAAYYQRVHDPVKEAKIRKARMHLHIEYCRQPEYRAWKKEYDRQYLAKKEHGEFWESALLIREIDQQVNARMSDYEIRMENGTINKAQQRRRAYERLISIKSENSPLGNA